MFSFKSLLRNFSRSSLAKHFKSAKSGNRTRPQIQPREQIDPAREFPINQINFRTETLNVLSHMQLYSIFSVSLLLGYKLSTERLRKGRRSRSRSSLRSSVSPFSLLPFFPRSEKIEELRDDRAREGEDNMGGKDAKKHKCTALKQERSNPSPACQPKALGVVAQIMILDLMKLSRILAVLVFCFLGARHEQ